MKRVLLLVIALSLFFCGCVTAKAPMKEIHTATDLEQTVPMWPEVPEQLPLSQEELASVMEKTELSLLSAAFLYDAYDISGAISNYDRFAYIDDIDKDGQIEMYYSESLLFFDFTNGRRCSYFYSQSGNHDLFVAKDGSVYYRYYTELTDFEHADHIDSFCPFVYGSYNPDATRFMLCVADYCKSGTPMETFVRIDGTDLSPEESKAFLDELGLKEVETGLQDYTSFTYDAVYADAITAGLENAFGIYQGSYDLDVDLDGENEQVFAYTDFVNTWFPETARDPNPDSYDAYMDNAFFFDYPGINPVDNRTGLIVADIQEGQLTLSAYSIPQIVSVGIDTYIDASNLNISGSSYLIPQAISTQDQQLSYLESSLQTQGYSNIFFTTSDLSDCTGDEVLCIAQQNGKWLLLVIRFDYGFPKFLDIVDLSNSACYLSTYEGHNCLVVYQQNQYSDGDGLYTSYGYELLRFDGEEYEWTLLSNYVGHYNDQEDATNISDFFTELNRYIATVIVVYDPFRLHGQQWIAPEEIIYGELPQAPEPERQPDANAEEKIGFVNISNPSSWLNLREGPGREYDCILTDPDDPGSIVKQAKGSPVTVLETIESEDPDFPVWYKVCIRYQDHEIIGYSAEAYIELVE